jgi:hypothetical protein
MRLLDDAEEFSPRRVFLLTLIILKKRERERQRVRPRAIKRAHIDTYIL